MPTVAELQKLIGELIMNTFGHPYLAGAVLFVVITYALYYHRVPLDAAIVIAVPILIGFAGVFIPGWIIPFVAIGLGVIISVSVLRLLGLL